jgi:hypothetical protein
MGRKIRIHNIKDILTNENYDKYCCLHFTTQHLSLLIQKNTCFSNQPDNVDNELIRIKEAEEYSDDFFVAAQRFINGIKFILLFFLLFIKLVMIHLYSHNRKSASQQKRIQKILNEFA